MERCCEVLEQVLLLDWEDRWFGPEQGEVGEQLEIEEELEEKEQRTELR
jgi:hypothetical protein